MGKKEEKFAVVGDTMGMGQLLAFLDLLYIEIKIPEKYFKDVQFSIGKKKK